MTELEGVILGIVHSRQPCSAYVVLGRFRASPTWGWSSSMGAIYPAIARLKTRGMIECQFASGTRRRTELLSLSDAGESALRDWILALKDNMGSSPIDPIRTRVNYLASLSRPDRTAFLDSAETLTRASLAQARERGADQEASDNWALEATLVGAALQLEARLKWLEKVRALSDNADP